MSCYSFMCYWYTQWECVLNNRSCFNLREQQKRVMQSVCTFLRQCGQKVATDGASGGNVNRCLGWEKGDFCDCSFEWQAQLVEWFVNEGKPFKLRVHLGKNICHQQLMRMGFWIGLLNWTHLSHNASIGLWCLHDFCFTIWHWQVRLFGSHQQNHQGGQWLSVMARLTWPPGQQREPLLR